MTTPNILVVRRRYMGDVVLVTPLLRNLRLHFPDAWVSVVVDSLYADVLATNPDLNEIIVLPVGGRGRRARARGWLRVLRQLTRRRFDLAIDLARNFRSRTCLRLSRAERRVSIDFDDRPLRRRNFYTDVAYVPADAFARQHINVSNAEMLRQIGVPSDFSELVLPLAPQAVQFAEQWLDAAAPRWRERPLLAAHIGTRRWPRRWPPERFAAAIAHAAQRATVVVLGCHEDEEFSQALAQHLPAESAHIAPPLTFQPLAAVIAAADAMLCHDSGPMHVAAAVGTPVVALFSSQSIATWRPLGAGHICLQGPLPCVCLAPEKCVPGDVYNTYCVQHIGVDEVCAALDHLLR